MKSLSVIHRQAFLRCPWRWSTMESDLSIGQILAFQTTGSLDALK